MQTALTYRTNRDLFSNYYLDEHLPETEEWDEVSDEELQQAYDDIIDLWEREKETAPKRNESQLEEKFIRPMFRKLGIPFEVEESTSRTQRRPDYGFFETEEAARDAFQRRDEGSDFYKNSVAVADAKRWGRPLDTRGSGEHERDFENPSYQIHVYLQETPARWAVLTDGKKWRLYYGPTSHRLDSYYEVDLPTILESGDLEDFKYFYLFFRHEAFLEDTGGDSFLDDVYGESNVFAQELGEDLQDNIYEAIKVLSEGFLQYPENDLDEDDLSRIHDSSLIYLYRLIFVLYAEAEGRELLDTSNEIYEQSYSLNSLKQEVAEEIDSGDPKYRDWQDNLQSRLDELFTLIDKGSKSRGIPEEDLYIPAYNGGLFRTDPDEDDSTEAKFLANHDVGDAYLAKVVELLTRSKNSNGGGKIFVDYSSLDVRHLGSIYEGLLEYQINVAHEPLAIDDGEYVIPDEGDDVVVQEGEVYLTTGSGERKATGSYYTPEYVVEYIVENTLEPLVSDIRNDLMAQSARGERGFAAEFAEQVFELKILDPAMGSGHFLTSAIDYLAREIIDAQEKQAAQQGIETVDKEHDINWARRQVAQRCIYGVDLNPLAVELAKVSLWLRTLAAEQPLAFLDHHLKTGNSLVGSDIEEIEELESDSGGDGQNASLADFGVARKGTIEQLMRIYEDFIAIENQELADVKEMESKYDEFERNKLRQRLEAMANVHTAEDFGLDNLPSDAYERMAGALEDDDKWASLSSSQWFIDAQKWASEGHYFHWKLEYPEVFYDNDGDKKGDSGFDAVIGNPPYMRIQTIRQADETMPTYFETEFDSSYKNYDIYALFIEKGHSLLSQDGEQGYIVPHKFMQAEFGEAVRSYVADRSALREVVDMGHYQVFGSAATTYTCLLFLSGQERDEFSYKKIRDDPRDLSSLDESVLASERIGEEPWILLSPAELGAVEKIEECTPLEELSDKIFVGIQTSKDSVYAVDLLEETEDQVTVSSEETGEKYEFSKEILVPYLKGEDVNRYETPENRKVLIFPYHTSDDGYSLMSPQEIKSKSPRVWDYLLENKSVLEDRDGGSMDGDDWYAYTYPKSLHEHEKQKIITPEISDNCSFTLDGRGNYSTSVIYSITASETEYDLEYLLAVLNSTTTWFYVSNTSHVLRGGYYRFKTGYLRPVGIPEVDTGEGDSSELDDVKERYQSQEYDVIRKRAIGLAEEGKEATVYNLLCYLVNERIEAQNQYESLNLDLSDHLGNYSEGDALHQIQGYQPPSDVSNTLVSETSGSRDSLRVGRVSVDRDRSKLTIKASARYKPEDEDAYETDQWGYTETELMPALEFVGLDEKYEKLISEFVPHIVNECDDGVAKFREKATKTNSLVDRLESLTLPDLSDIEDSFDRYLGIKTKADGLQIKAENTDDIINQIVYRLYGMTDDEIEIVEDSVSE
jgi:type II restriction/modification system DNA methylase subunit YeeA